MAQSLARVTGNVLNVSHRSGKKKETGEPWSMTNVLVLVAGSGVSEVSWPSDASAPVPGDEIDVLVSLSVYRNEPQLRAERPFPVSLSA